MYIKKNRYHLTVALSDCNDYSKVDFNCDVVVITVFKGPAYSRYINDHIELRDIIVEFYGLKNIFNIAFFSKKDGFKGIDVINFLNKGMKELTGIQLLISYQQPPMNCFREDGPVSSFLISSQNVDWAKLLSKRLSLASLTFSVVYSVLKLKKSADFAVFQIGKPEQIIPIKEILPQLKRAAVIIPHKGSIGLLERCLGHLDKNEHLPNQIDICFDDRSYRKINLEHFACGERVNRYINQPLNVGPYPARHAAIEQSTAEYIFFHDSDDISFKERFSKQIHELESRKLDMVGSHELRIDQVLKKVFVVRFPIDVNGSLEKEGLHCLLHPTALIRSSAYKKTGGFSTDMKFGYDAQFLLRSYFFLKIGNIDDFLYVRFKRPNSLTTNKSTKIGGRERNFLSWRWQIDFDLIKKNELNLADSSLAVQQHDYSYNLKKLNPLSRSFSEG